MKKKIHTLNKNQYIDFIKELKLEDLKANTFGLEEHHPLKNQNNINSLFDDYQQRENWFEIFLNTKLDKPNLKNIIWSESARAGNKEYIYNILNNTFKFENKKSKYFCNVFESHPFDECMVIDFFGFLGINHSNDSRNYLNINANKDKIHNIYLENYIDSIFNLVDIDKQRFINLNHTIAAPVETSKSILNYMRSQLNIKSQVKIYKLNTRGLVTDEYYTDAL